MFSSTVECQYVSRLCHKFGVIMALKKLKHLSSPPGFCGNPAQSSLKLLKPGPVPGQQGRIGSLCMQCQEFGNNRARVYYLTVCYRAPHLTCALADMWGSRTRWRCSTNRLTNTTRSRPGTRSAPMQALRSTSPHSTRTTLTTAGKRSSWTCRCQLVNARMMEKSSALSVRCGLFNLRSY